MGFDFEQRKTLLYADLFRGHKGMAMGEVNQNGSIMSQYCEGWSSSSNQSSSSCDSSSSGFSTPFGSELGSSETEDGDFIAELSRQMAECMLQEEEEEEDKEEERNKVTNSAAIKNLKYGLSSSHQVCDHVDQTSFLELKNQPPVSKQEGPVSRGRRVKGAELTQQMQLQKTEQNYGRYRERDWRIGQGRKGQVGSGMRAIFLGGSGSRNGSSGTGVFLPRVAKDPVELKKKSGLSTVLIPTRVLETLELHFNRLSDSAAPPLTTGGSPHHASPRDEWSRSKGQKYRHSKLQIGAANKDEEMQILPQEWTY